MQSSQFRCIGRGLSVGNILKASFSTTRAALAERPLFSSTSDLANVDAPPAQAHQSRPPFQTRRSTGPLSIPNRRGGLRNTENKDRGHDRLEALIAQQARKQQAKAVAALANGRPSETTTEMLERDELAKNLTLQIKRRFKPGDIYAPHDLSWQEQQRWRKKNAPTHDVFDITNFNPLDHYKNFMVLSEYVTPLGRIMHRKDTGLRAVNQRRIAKAIRRSIGMGMMPSVHKHPELLQQDARKQAASNLGFF